VFEAQRRSTCGPIIARASPSLPVIFGNSAVRIRVLAIDMSGSHRLSEESILSTSWRRKSRFSKIQPISGPSGGWSRWMATSSLSSGSSGSGRDGRPTHQASSSCRSSSVPRPSSSRRTKPELPSHLKKKLPEVIDTLISAIRAGEFDDHFAQASKQRQMPTGRPGTGMKTARPSFPEGG
jgi:hypothetical protein